MGRVIAIAGGDLETTRPINSYAVGMLKSETKNALFIGTASLDAEEYRKRFEKEFTDLGCEVKTLELATRLYTEEEIGELLKWADLIYVGCGDTIFMRNVWKEYGLDKLLRGIYEIDSAVLMGLSAGAMCWFVCGCTDSELIKRKHGLSYGWADELLGMEPYGFCPHYESREEDFQILIEEKKMDMYALESGVAFVEENGKISFVRCKAEAKAFALKWEDDIRYVKTEQDVKSLE